MARTMSGRLPGILALVSAAMPAFAADAEQRGQAFWLALAQECAVPTGESAAGLVNEAVAMLGSPDPTWRDDIGYGVVVACVYRKRLLAPAERGSLVSSLAANLERGIGDDGGQVLLRSFSALDLAVLAALELQDPALDAAAYRRLLDAALAYLQDERDLRGFEPPMGWIHATAHTADLLKFLARDSRFTRTDQARLLEAAWARMTAPDTPVYTHAEDERLAAALVSVLRRPDFDAAILEPWLERFVALEKRTWEGPARDPDLLAAAHNARNLLQALFVLAAFPDPVPTAGQLAAREQLLATLQRIRR